MSNAETITVPHDHRKVIARVHRAKPVQKRLTEDLKAGTDREQRPPCCNRTVQCAASEPADREGLCAVLATAEHIEIGLVRHRLIDPDVYGLSGDPAPTKPLCQHAGVAPVAVGPEHRREDQRDPHWIARRPVRSTPSRTSAAPPTPTAGS